MGSTHSRVRATWTPPDGAPLRRAWVAVALIPVFFLLALAVAQLLYSVMGYLPEDDDVPLGVELAATIPALVAFLLPCAAAVLYGRRSSTAGDRRGLLPLAIGALAGLGFTILSLVTIVAGVLAGR